MWYVPATSVVIHVHILTVTVIKMYEMIRGWHNHLVRSNLTSTKYMNRLFFFYELEIKIYLL